MIYEFKENYLSNTKYPHSINMAIFVLSLCFAFSTLYWNTNYELTEYLVANQRDVFTNKEYWRLITTIFVHGEPSHLLSNSIMLLIMGHYVHAFYGKYNFPLLAFISGSLVNALVLLNFENINTNIVGISGVVYYLWGFWLYLYIKIQTHIPILRRFMKVSIVGAVLLIPEVFEANVSHLSHFLGFVFGVLIALIYWEVQKKKILSYEKYELKDEENFVDIENREVFEINKYRIISE